MNKKEGNFEGFELIGFESLQSYKEEEQDLILIPSTEDRRYLTAMMKKGFTTQQRRECWLLATGTKQAIATASRDYYYNLVRFAEKLC